MDARGYFIAVGLKEWEKIKGKVDVPEPSIEEDFAVWSNMSVEELSKVYKKLIEVRVVPTFAKLPWVKPWVRAPWKYTSSSTM